MEQSILMENSIETRIQSWLDGPFDEQVKDEIKQLQLNNPQALSDAFFKELSFGTGGMRGIMGVGTNRLNIYTIQMATQGLANYIKTLPTDGKHSVFIGYDVRNNSRLFAEETAKVFSGNGIKALLSKDICPTPLVSFACRHYKCSMAVMITASHNPPQYNGYKVYWHDGAQVVPPYDQEIIEMVRQVTSPAQVRLGSDYEEIDSEIDAVYLSQLEKLQMLPELSKVDLKIIYTNLHGTGIRLIPKALKSWGYTHLTFVEKQLPLDGNFSFAPSPNPEDEKALELGTKQLAAENGDILIATDPDADRMGVVVRGGRLTGNQIACLCLHHICTTLTEKKEFPENGAFIKTIVTTELFKEIAEHFGGKCIDVLTGFKYIGEQIGIWEASFDSYQYLFGAEESYGYLFGSFVRDKDAISSACLIVEVAALAKKKNLTLIDRLNQIYQTFGIHRESLTNLNFSDSKAGMDQMTRLMHTLRSNPPTSIGNLPITLVEDYLLGKDSLPPSNVLRFWLEDGSKLVIRPSGTEPKIKIYAEVKGAFENEKSVDLCDTRLKQLVDNFKKQVIHD